MRERTANGKARAGAHRAVVVGESHEVPFALQHPALLDAQRFKIAAVVPIDGPSEGFPTDEIRRQVRDQQADTILVAGPASRALMQRLGELSITLGCRLFALLPASVPEHVAPMIIWEGDFPFIQMAAAGPQRVAPWAKRAFDVTVAACGLLLVAPFLLLASIAIRLESPGAPWFGHERMGRGGRRFRCWKLRTMIANAEQRLQQDAALRELYEQHDFKLPHGTDPRVTRIGRILRRTSLDELPQLWNVLVGDMSLVGPRPLVPEELRHYAGHVLTLLSVRPGITGAWAVNGRHALAYPRRADVELAYVRSVTLTDDLRILVRTVAAIID